MALDEYAARRERAREALAKLGAAWLLVPPSADFRWLTGAVSRATERPVVLAIPRDGEPFVFVPRLEADALAKGAPDLALETWTDGEDPVARLAARLDLGPSTPVLVGEGLRTAPLLGLAAAAPCRPAAEALAPLRAIKSAAEIERLGRAAVHADRVVEATADFARPGMTEREVAAFARARFEELGDTDAWVTVASGPNAAVPHHATSERRLREDEVLLLDLGAFTEGYGSDITRTYWLGAAPGEFVHVYDLVRQAREAGIAASRPGAACQEVDRAARRLVDSGGLGERFIHRTGHGVGLEVHEPPFLVEGNAEPLAPGMVHSVEPGVYLPDRWGVRLEDLVVVTGEGAARLNRAPLDPRPPRLRT